MNDGLRDHPWIGDSLSIVRGFFKFIVDVYMMWIFLTTFRYLVALKEEHSGDLTPYNRRVIAITYAILALNIVQVLQTSIISTLYHHS